MLIKNKLALLTMLGALTFSTLAFSETRQLSSKLLTVNTTGKLITFKDDDKTVKSKVSGSRTKVTINGSAGNRKSLKAGMICVIKYKPGGKNEPEFLNCK